MGCSGMGYRRRDQQGEMRWDRGSGMGWKRTGYSRMRSVGWDPKGWHAAEWAWKVSQYNHKDTMCLNLATPGWGAACLNQISFYPLMTSFSLSGVGKAPVLGQTSPRWRLFLPFPPLEKRQDYSLRRWGLSEWPRNETNLREIFQPPKVLTLKCTQETRLMLGVFK